MTYPALVFILFIIVSTTSVIPPPSPKALARNAAIVTTTAPTAIHSKVCAPCSLFTVFFNLENTLIAMFFKIPTSFQYINLPFYSNNLNRLSSPVNIFNNNKPPIKNIAVGITIKVVINVILGEAFAAISFTFSFFIFRISLA